MTVDQLIKKQDPDEIIFLGTKHGSGYYWIGTKKQYVKEIKDVSNKFVLDAMERLNTYHEHRRKLARDLDEISMLPESDLSRIYVVAKSIAAGTQRIKQSDRLIPKERSYLDGFVPLMKREVIDDYPRIQRDGYVIIHEGIEPGGYWYAKEYHRD